MVNSLGVRGLTIKTYTIGSIDNDDCDIYDDMNMTIMMIVLLLLLIITPLLLIMVVLIKERRVPKYTFISRGTRILSCKKTVNIFNLLSSFTNINE